MQKGFLTIISAFLALAMFVSCTNAKSDTTTSAPVFVKQTTLSEKGDNKNLTDTIANSNANGLGGGVITIQKYRNVYFDIPIYFANIVGNDVCVEWLQTVKYAREDEIMIMKLFIQHFGITREQFDKANLELAKGIKYSLHGIPCINPKDYANQDDDEIYNADIIYTFDDDIIREYYLSPDYPYLYDFEFEEAVEKGEYTAQTEEWVDLEKMEAEVIAKYGNIEYETKPEMSPNELYERYQSVPLTAASD